MPIPTKNRIVIAGGSGFLGMKLREMFQAQGKEVRILSRSRQEGEYLPWDGKTLGAWAEALNGAEALINMAGRTVNCRYTAKNKAEILDSRIDSTRVLGEAVAACQRPPRVWLNSSTATIYDDTRGDLPANTEAKGKIGDDFSMGVAKAWEEEFFRHDLPDTVRTALRSAIIMGAEGGAFPVTARLAKKGLCSKQGPGDQWISWMHIDDFCASVDFLLKNPQAGPINLCAPHPIRNAEYNHLLKAQAKPLIVLPQPKWVLELGAVLIQTQTELILKSRKVYPERLLEAGFRFKYERADKMVADLFPAVFVG
ncbi:MAG: TIGR01777 family oxidoreductase [Bacteroidota bacterium]